jgi:Kef-type K+ transport system membrane component KefB
MDFSQLALILVVAGVFGIIARSLKQPLLVGYLFAGLTLSEFGIISDTSSLEGLGRVGVALLLFLLGLEMNIGELPTIGKTALLTGIGQIVFTSAMGYLLSLLLGFGFTQSLYIAICLSFSSTIIMVKLLSEKKDLSSLYGRIAVGFLLVQDFVAVIILMLLSGLGQGTNTPNQYVMILIKAVLLFAGTWFLSRKILPKFFEKIAASSNELLFIVSIAWALGVSAFVANGLGFTLEIGGFLSGLALSNLPEHLQIASKTRTLRDFFLTLFFFLLGTKLIISGNILIILIPSVIFSVFVLVGNPIIVMAIMGLLGYKKRTSFFAGLTVAQISEFSLILIAMGATLGHVNQNVVAMVVLVGVITMTISTYMILGADEIFRKIKSHISIFESKNPKEAVLTNKINMVDHIVLVGCDRTGRSIAAYFKKRNITYIVVDFNPTIYKKLSADNTPVIFGDINDPEVMEAANLDKARMVISTTSNLNDNLTMLEYIKLLHTSIVTVFTASTKNDAIKLYEKGATYLIVPDVVAGEHIKHIMRTYGYSQKRFIKLGKGHFNRLIYA